MKYDKPLMAVLIGILVTIPLETYTQIFKYFGVTILSAFELSSIMMYKEGSWWIGLLTLPGTGGLAGLLLFESGRKLGTDYLPIKGAGIGMVTYGMIAAIFGTLGRNLVFGRLSIAGHYVHASAGFWGGLLAGFLIKKYVFDTHNVKGTKWSRVFTAAPVPARKHVAEPKRVVLVRPKKR